MALIERIMKDPVEPEERFIATHQFFASIAEILYGNLTQTQVQNYYQMTVEDLVDWNALVALIPPQNQVAERTLYVEHIHSVFILAESKIPTYSTPTEVRTRLGI